MDDRELLANAAQLTKGCCTPDQQFNAWLSVFAGLRPLRYLEVGAFKGRSLFLATYLARHFSPGALFHTTSIDSWEGGAEHITRNEDMQAAESCFDDVVGLCKSLCDNLSFSFRSEKIKSLSFDGLLKVAGRRNYYDIIFIDGSHRSSDVLADAVLAWPLLRERGVMIFDDYSWQPSYTDCDRILDDPKLGIDSFVNCYRDQLYIISQLPLCQFYVCKYREKPLGAKKVNTCIFPEYNDKILSQAIRNAGLIDG